MTSGGFLKTLLVALAFVVIFLGGVWVGGHPASTGLDQLADGPRHFFLGSTGQGLSAEVIDVLKRSYYKPVDAAKLEGASVAGLVASLDDPYTEYLDPKALEALREDTRGQYSGVGLQVAARGRSVVVTGVFPKSPAKSAGIQVGDRLASVDGRSVVGAGITATVQAIKGPEGSTVKVGVLRPGRREPLVFTLTRREISAPQVAARLVRRNGKPIGYVRLAQFTQGSSKDLRHAVQTLLGRHAEALVLDLRQDPGGLVDEAIGAASIFLPKGATVVTTQGAHEARRTLRTGGGTLGKGVPMVVLVDRGSASASEILAGALRDDGRATLVGTRTFGKALVQTTKPLRNGGALKLTVARYVTPKGLDIGHRGLEPSVSASDDPRTGVDEALQRALAVAAAKR